MNIMSQKDGLGKSIFLFAQRNSADVWKQMHSSAPSWAGSAPSPHMQTANNFNTVQRSPHISTKAKQIL